MMAKKSTWYGCIYLFENTINFMHYVGQTTLDFRIRVMQHVQAANAGSKCALHVAIRESGSNVVFVVRVLSRHRTKKALDAAEKHWIKLWGSRTTQHGYNHTAGGEGAAGYEFSTEDRARTSEGVAGYWKSLSPEMRALVIQIRAEKRHEVNSKKTRAELIAIKDKWRATWAVSDKRDATSRAHSECAKKQWAVLTEEERAAKGREHSEKLLVTLSSMSAAERKEKFNRVAKMSPERLAEWKAGQALKAKEQWEAMTDEQRTAVSAAHSIASTRVWAGKSEVERAAIGAKIRETRGARDSYGVNAVAVAKFHVTVAKRSDAERAAIGKKIWATRRRNALKKAA